MSGELYDQGAPEFYVDGFEDYEIRNGVMTCAGFRESHGMKTVIVRFVIPLANVPNTIALAMSAMRAVPTHGLIIGAEKLVS